MTENITQNTHEPETIFEQVDCNLCNSNDYTVIYESRYQDEKDSDLAAKFRSSGDETLIDQVVECKRCRLQYINPRLKPSLIIEGYSEGSDEAFISQAKGRELTFAKTLKIIHKYARNGKILDIGTAGGSFLQSAKKQGWDVYGCELNKWLCNWAKENYGIEVQQGTVFEQNYEDNQFDVVTLWDVLEHVPDPKKVLEECHRILKPNGILVVNYPDIGSWIAKVMGRKWFFYLSVHLYYFTPKTMRKILRLSGFKTKEIRPHYQKLGLGYLMVRMKAYSKLLHHLGSAIVRGLGL